MKNRGMIAVVLAVGALWLWKRKAEAAPEAEPEPQLAEFYMPAQMRKAKYPTIDPYTVCEVWLDITNKGDVPGVQIVHIWDSAGNVDTYETVILPPGETYTWHRSQWIGYGLSSYWVKAQGNWVGNNYSEAGF